MSAETLREAARLMRECAEGVGGALDAHPATNGNPADGPTYIALTVDNEEVAEVYGCAAGDRLVQHVCSWHPVVALAVADWLAFTSEVWREDDECRSPIGPDESCGGCDNCDHRWTRQRALAVARAYLGEQP